MKIPESRLFSQNNQAAISILAFNRDLTLEELGAYCVMSSTNYCWWKDLEEIAAVIGVTKEKAEQVRDSLVAKKCAFAPKEIPSDEEQTLLAQAVYDDFNENLEQE